jgi:hypothetical protein
MKQKHKSLLIFTIFLFLILSVQVSSAYQEITIKIDDDIKLKKFYNLQDVKFILPNDVYIYKIYVIRQDFYDNGKSKVVCDNFVLEYNITNFQNHFYIYRTFTFNLAITYYNSSGELTTYYYTKDEFTFLNYARTQISIVDNNTQTDIFIGLGGIIYPYIKLTIDGILLPIQNYLSFKSDYTAYFEIDLITSIYIMIEQLHPLLKFVYTLVSFVDTNRVILTIMLFLQNLIYTIVAIIYYLIFKPYLIILMFEGFALFYSVKTTRTRKESISKFLNINIEFLRKVLNLFAKLFELIIKMLRG